jgi:hypothetical protein
MQLTFLVHSGLIAASTASRSLSTFCALLWPRYFARRVQHLDGVTHAGLTELMVASQTGKVSPQEEVVAVQKHPQSRPLFFPALSAKGLIDFVVACQETLVPEEDRDAGIDSRWALLVDEKWMQMNTGNRIKLLNMLTGKRKGHPELQAPTKVFIEEMSQLCRAEAFKEVHLHHMILLSVLGGVCDQATAHRFFEEITVRCIINYLVAE